MQNNNLLILATQKFIAWASRLDEREAATVKAALDALGIQKGSPEAMLLTGFLAGVEAGIEIAEEN